MNLIQLHPEVKRIPKRKTIIDENSSVYSVLDFKVELMIKAELIINKLIISWDTHSYLKVKMDFFKLYKSHNYLSKFVILKYFKTKYYTQNKYFNLTFFLLDLLPYDIKSNYLNIMINQYNLYFDENNIRYLKSISSKY